MRVGQVLVLQVCSELLVPEVVERLLCSSSVL